MKITKFVHSCLLVEMPTPVNRTVLFDPGAMSEQALDVDRLEYLDDICITHNHYDHLNVPLVKKLVAKFPDVRITTTPEAARQLGEDGIRASTEAPDGMEFFDSPHEKLVPGLVAPEQIGIHYLGKLSDPGDSHSFHETKAILALPVTAPWGSMVTAVDLALELKPNYILPIHDWHWRDEARQQMYDSLEQLFARHDITFCKLVDGQPVVLDV